MQDLAESRNVAMAQVFQNSLRTPLEALMSDAVGRDDEYLRQSESAASLQASVLELLRDTAWSRSRIYNRLGNTAFSTDPAQIGESRLDSPGFVPPCAVRWPAN
jgi:hypothetical protein